MTKTSETNDLAGILLGQEFPSIVQKDLLLAECKLLADACVKLDDSVAVLSDFQENKSYIYVGQFGKLFGLTIGMDIADSAFEECIFSKVHPDDLIERHILELSYFEHQKQLPPDLRRHFSTCSRIRALNIHETYSYVTHRTIYLKNLSNDSIWLALCTYAPAADLHPRNGIDGKIINNQTGEVISFDNYKRYGGDILSHREREVLSLVAQGMGSKQIAERLSIAVHTVRRHRQNIIGKMRVSNSAEAVRLAISMGIIFHNS